MADNIRVILFQDGDAWVAQCIEYDIAAQADDVDTVRRRLSATLKCELMESKRAGKKPLEGIEPAPDRFRDLWEKRARNVTIDPENTGSGTEVEYGLAA